MTIHEHIKETLGKCDAATPGPYYYAIDLGEPELYYNAIWSNSRPNPNIANMVMDDPDAEKNAALFAHARTALPQYAKALEVAVMGIDGEIGAASCCGRTGGTMTMLPTERGRELDAAIAVEVMGLPSPAHPRLGYAMWLHSYSSDAREARFMEAHVGVIGLARPYIRHMLAQVDDADLYWQLLRAAPEQRCLAALAAVRESKGGGK